MLYVRHGLGFDYSGFSPLNWPRILQEAIAGGLTPEEKQAQLDQLKRDCLRSAGGDAARAQECYQKGTRDVQSVYTEAEKQTTTISKWVTLAAVGLGILVAARLILR